MARRNFSDMNRFFFALSTRKGICLRHLADLRGKREFASKPAGVPDGALQHANYPGIPNITPDVLDNLLPNVVSSHECVLIKTGKGIDPRLQQNKAVNTNIASAAISGMIIHPGQTFSFWHAVGTTSRRKGYLDGRVIVAGKLRPGLGGGLCNLGNTVNLLVLHSPLQIVEFHKHSDALAPDHGPRVPLSSGTSVSYNYIDYRFENTTDQDVQLVLWCDAQRSYGQLRSQREFPFRYELIEEGHHFQKEGGKYYRVSKIYRQTIDRKTGEVVGKQLVWDNHSEVMFDYDEIPRDQIWE